MNAQQLSFFPEHYVVLDVETRRSAQEVGGWQKKKDMGVSLAVLYDSHADNFTWYEQDAIPDLTKHLLRAKFVVGFNIMQFDYGVLQPHAQGFNFARLHTIDLLQHLHAALNFRISLNNVAEATLKTPKSADGLLALQWWRQGELDKIGQYCQQDVALTRDIFLFGTKHGVVYYTRKDKTLASAPALWQQRASAHLNLTIQ